MFPTESVTAVSEACSSTETQVQQAVVNTSNSPVNNRTTPAQSEEVTADVLANDVAPNIGHRDCIALASALGFDPPYITMLTSSDVTKTTAHSILFDWLARSGSNATYQALQNALKRINRLDLAEKIMTHRAQGKRNSYQ